MQYCYHADTCYGQKKAGFANKVVTQENCCSKGGGSWGVSGTDHCDTCPQEGELGKCSVLLLGLIRTYAWRSQKQSLGASISDTFCTYHINITILKL